MGFGTLTNKMKDRLLKQAQEYAKKGDTASIRRMIDQENERKGFIQHMESHDPEFRKDLQRRKMREDIKEESKKPKQTTKTLPNGQEAWLGDDGEWYVD